MAKYYDVWSPAEKKMQKQLEKIKSIIFYPFITILTLLKISPNMITLLSAAFGIIASVVMVHNLTGAVIWLAAALILDGLDGALARALKKVTKKGSTIDVIGDQTTIIATSTGMGIAGIASLALGITYSFLYALLVMLTLYRNREGKPHRYVLRPRFYVYGLLLLFALTGINLLNSAMLLFSVIIGAYVIIDMIWLLRKN